MMIPKIEKLNIQLFAKTAIQKCLWCTSFQFAVHEASFDQHSAPEIHNFYGDANIPSVRGRCFMGKDKENGQRHVVQE